MASAHGRRIDDVMGRIQPKRKIDGYSALLLPFGEDGRPDFDSYSGQLRRTVEAGLTPAVNMDTGYVNLLSDEERLEVLTVARDVLGGRPFVAGVFVEGKEGDLVSLYRREIDRVRSFDAMPILFQTSPMQALDTKALVDVYARVAQGNGPLFAFELGSMFAPFGMIWNEEAARGIMEIPEIIGYKHSSLSRMVEWSRLELRDRVRPDFKILTGNDLAIDMVMYGSDYLLGLSTFAPEAFGLRDRLWEAGDARFYELNDVLQYLGELAFRPPTPAYKHSAAQFLHLRKAIATDRSHPDAPTRPASDREILALIAERVDAIVASCREGGLLESAG